MFERFLAVASGPVVYVSPSTIFKVAGFDVTNSVLYGWLITIICLVVFIWTARKVRLFPGKGFVGALEAGVDFIINLVESSFNDVRVGRKYVPYFVTLFFFILFNNWSELLPISGDGILGHGNPLLRPFTADLNATFAMGAITMGLVYYASVKESGGIGPYLRHFFVGSPKNPLYLIIGMLEMLTDLTRVISLSLRLFLNITIGEIVIAVFAYLGHFLAPLTALPFFLIESFICI